MVTSPPGLTVNVDGQDDSKGTLRLWGQGQVHHLVAPATQTDATGHPWQFVSWSVGGAASQSFTVPSGLPGLTITATYAPLGKLQVDSVPTGLPFVVDGSACTTPCILLSKPTGAQVQVAAPAFGIAGPIQTLRFPYLERRQYLQHLLGHDYRFSAGFRRDVSGVL